jgi:hypothetical protein
VAPATRAPLGSVTVPIIEPTACDQRAGGEQSAKTRRQETPGKAFPILRQNALAKAAIFMIPIPVRLAKDGMRTAGYLSEGGARNLRGGAGFYQTASLRIRESCESRSYSSKLASQIAKGSCFDEESCPECKDICINSQHEINSMRAYRTIKTVGP